MKKKISFLTGTLIAAMMCTGIAATALLWHTPAKEPPTTVFALDANKSEVKVNAVNYSTDWGMTLLEMNASCGASSWVNGDTAHMQITQPNGLHYTPTDVVQQESHIYVGLNNRTEPEVGTVITLQAGYSYSSTHEIKTDVSYIYNESMQPWLEFNPTSLTPSMEEITIYTDGANSVTVTFTTAPAYTTAPIVCWIEDGSVASVTSNGLSATVTGASAIGTTKLHVSCGNAETVIPVHVVTSAAELVIKDVTLSETGELGWGYMIHFTDANGVDVSSGVTDTPTGVPNGVLNRFEIRDSSGNDIIGMFHLLYYQSYLFVILKDHTVHEYETGTTLTFKTGFLFGETAHELKDDSKYVCLTPESHTLVFYDASVHAPTGITPNNGNAVALKLNNKQNTWQFTVTVSPSTAATTVKYTTDNPSVATVDSNGVITATGKGRATITAQAGTVWTTCTVDVTYTVGIKSMSANAAGTLSVSYKLYFADGFTPASGAKIIGRVTDTTKNEVIREVQQNITSLATSDGYYLFELPIAPAELTCPITIQFVDSDGTGNTVSGKTLNDYLTYQQNTNAASFANALRTYGTYAQIRFGTNTNALAMDVNSVALPDTIASDLTKTGECTGADFTKVDLNADADTTMRVKVNLTGDSSNYKFVLSYVDITGQTRNFNVTEDALQDSYIEIPRVAAALLDREYTLTCTNKTDKTKVTMTFSAIDCMSLQVSSADTDTAQKNLAKAMYLYALAANEYFGV